MGAAERFATKVVPLLDGCHAWSAAIGSDGYGVFWLEGRLIGAHRAAWLFAYGSVPDAALVLHRCDHPYCVRPEHLFLGSAADNAEDMTRKGRGRIGDRNGRRRRPERWPAITGEANPAARLTVDRARAILADGRHRSEIAADHDVAESTVRAIKKRLTWRHVQ